MAGDYVVVGFDAATGDGRWRFDPPIGYGAGVYLGEARGGLVFAGSASGHLYGIEVLTGKLRWSTQPVVAPRTTVFAPHVDRDDVVAGYTTFDSPATGGVVVVDRRSGQQRWRREFPRGSAGAANGFGGGPVVAGRVVIAAGGDGSIHAFDRVTGDRRWVLPPIVRPDGRTQDRDWRALAVSGRTLIAGSVSGLSTAFDLEDRRERWRYAHPEGGSVALGITVDHDMVYIPHLAGRLVALSLRDGRQRWEIGGFSDGFNWAPLVAGDVVYVAASRAGLFALGR
jgi:outer membrane protein assembly factor BamB